MFRVGGRGQAGLGVDLALGMIDRLDQVLIQKDSLHLVWVALFLRLSTKVQFDTKIIFRQKWPEILSRD